MADEQRKPDAVQTFVLVNPHGLHCRPIAKLFGLAEKFGCTLWVDADPRSGAGDCTTVKASITHWKIAGFMELLMSGANKDGSCITLGAIGPKAKDCLDAIGQAITVEFPRIDREENPDWMLPMQLESD